MKAEIVSIRITYINTTATNYQPQIALFSTFSSLIAKTLNFNLSKNDHSVNESLYNLNRRKEFYNFSHISFANTITLLINSGLEPSVFKLTFS
jgi:hypothetical protein